MDLRTNCLTPKRDPERGVTLLEVLVVLAIVAMVATVAAPRVLDSFGRAKTQTATVQMANIKAALQIYYLDNGIFPSETQGLQALIDAPDGTRNWMGPYMDPPALLDPWGRQYLYRFPGQNGEFDVFTFGRDGQPGGYREDRDTYL